MVLGSKRDDLLHDAKLLGTEAAYVLVGYKQLRLLRLALLWEVWAVVSWFGESFNLRGNRLNSTQSRLLIVINVDFQVFLGKFLNSGILNRVPVVTSQFFCVADISLVPIWRDKVVDPPSSSPWKMSRNPLLLFLRILPVRVRKDLFWYFWVS